MIIAHQFSYVTIYSYIQTLWISARIFYNSTNDCTNDSKYFAGASFGLLALAKLPRQALDLKMFHLNGNANVNGIVGGLILLYNAHQIITKMNRHTNVKRLFLTLIYVYIYIFICFLLAERVHSMELFHIRKKKP